MTGPDANSSRTTGDPPPPSHGAARARDWRDLGPRAASACILALVALAALEAGGAPFFVFWLAAGCGVLWEWLQLAGGPRLIPRFALGGAGLAIAAFFAARASPDAAVESLIVSALALIVVGAPGNRLWSGCGVIYAGALVVSVCLLRYSILDGTEAVIWLFAVVWSADVMAYFGGRLIGGAKLWPRVSPTKTWAGFLIGSICGALVGALALHLMRAPLGVTRALLLGGIAAIVAQAGDLFESTLKRHFGAKDSGSLIPGHGGLMDRLDGFLTAATLAAILGTIRAGAAAAALGLLRWS